MSTTDPDDPPYAGADIYTEPDADPDTLANLGPLAAMAGIWEGAGVDEHPVVDGTESDAFVERYELRPIDPQTNGPQLLYGLRYHTHLVKPGEVETFHDQVGYWLWEPATSTVTMTLAIPRAQVLLASGPAAADATEFELAAVLGSQVDGILSGPFLDTNFRTVSFHIAVTTSEDGTWSYVEEAVLEIPDRDEPFRHVDRNTLTRVAPPTPNPLALAAAVEPTSDGGSLGSDGGSLGIGDLRAERSGPGPTATAPLDRLPGS